MTPSATATRSGHRCAVTPSIFWSAQSAPDSPPCPQVAPAVHSRPRRLFLLLVMLWALLVSSATIRAGKAGSGPSAGQQVSTAAVSRSSAALRAHRNTAPRLQVKDWFDQSGRRSAPVLEGKIQLVVFWGINCPACVRKIPQVRRAAARHAKTDLVVLGVHTARVSPSRLQQFARERSLNYPLAIDRAAGTRYSFGLTNDAFRVRAIPNAAVVDRDGSLSYVGSFEEALRRAEALLTTSG